MNYVIVILCIITSILAQTIFDNIQILFEAILFCALIFEFRRLKITYEELILLAVLLMVSLVSLFINTFAVFLVDFKVFALSILALFYFNKVSVNLSLITFFTYLNVAFIVFQYVVGYFPIPGISSILGSFAGFENNRTLGLFLNTHLSAYLIAIYFLYKSIDSRIYFLAGLLIVFLTLSKFTLISYLICYLSRFRKLFYISIITGLFLFSVFVAYIMNIETNSGLYSATVILGQLINLDTYKEAFNMFPGDYLLFIRNQLNNLGPFEYPNEIAYISMMIQGGLILVVLYLRIVLRYIKFTNVFILVSLLHYGFILNPLVICFFLVLERKYFKNTVPKPTLKAFYLSNASYTAS